MSSSRLQEYNDDFKLAQTLQVPSLVATALIVPGSPTSTTTFYVNFSVISARTQGAAERWICRLLLRVDEALERLDLPPNHRRDFSRTASCPYNVAAEDARLNVNTVDPAGS